MIRIFMEIYNLEPFYMNICAFKEDNKDDL